MINQFLILYPTQPTWSASDKTLKMADGFVLKSLRIFVKRFQVNERGCPWNHESDGIFRPSAKGIVAQAQKRSNAAKSAERGGCSFHTEGLPDVNCLLGQIHKKLLMGR
jgi:hypothetical protein